MADVRRAEAAVARAGGAVGLAFAILFGALGWTALACEAMAGSAILVLVMAATERDPRLQRTRLASARARIRPVHRNDRAPID